MFMHENYVLFDFLIYHDDGALDFAVNCNLIFF